MSGYCNQGFSQLAQMGWAN